MMVWPCWYSAVLLDFWSDICRVCIYIHMYVLNESYIHLLRFRCIGVWTSQVTACVWGSSRIVSGRVRCFFSIDLYLQPLRCEITFSQRLQVVLKAVKCDGWALQWADQVGEVGIRRWGCWWFFGLEVFFFLKVCCVLYTSRLFFFFQSRFLLFFLAVFRLRLENVERIFYRNW